MKTAAILMSLLLASPAFADKPSLGRVDHSGAMLAVPMGWLVAKGAAEDGGVAQVKQTDNAMSPVIMLEWGPAGDQTVDALLDARVTKLAAEMAVGSATESARVDFGEGGRRATLEAGMMGVSVPIEVAARIVDGRFLVAIYTGPPTSHVSNEAPALVEEMLTRSVWSGDLPANSK